MTGCITQGLHLVHCLEIEVGAGLAGIGGCRTESREQRAERLVQGWRLAYSMDINSWGGRRKLLQRGGMESVGGEDRRGP